MILRNGRIDRTYINQLDTPCTVSSSSCISQKSLCLIVPAFNADEGIAA